MRRYVPLLILTVGLGLSAAFAARSAPDHEVWRRQVWEAAEAGQDAPDPPAPEARLSGWFGRSGIGWGLGVGVVLLGAVLARRQQAAEIAAGGEGEGAVDFAATLDALDAEVEALAGQIAELPMDADATAPREAIDRLLTEVIGPVVDARGVLIAKYGVATFASYFGPFSGGERQLARTWSALTDGHSVVAREALGQARESFAHARAAWEAAG